MELIKLLIVSLFITGSGILSSSSYAFSGDNIQSTQNKQSTGHNILINDKVMSLLANNTSTGSLYELLGTGTIEKLKPYCNTVTTGQVIRLTAKNIEKTNNKKTKAKILLKAVYLYKCVLTRIEKERREKEEEQRLMEMEAEKQMINIISTYLRNGWYNKIKRLRLTDKTKQLIRDKVNELITPLNVFDKPSSKIDPYNKLANDFKTIQFIVRKKNENIEGFRTGDITTDPNIDLYDAIKIASMFGPRYLTKSWEFHFGYDITLLDKKKDTEYNCQYKPNYYHNITTMDYIMHKFFFNKEKDCKNVNNLPNYKDNYDIFTKIDLEQLEKNGGECYIGKHLSKYSDKLVGFGNFLICRLDKNDNVRTLFGHNNIDFNKLLRKYKFFNKIGLNSPEYVKVDSIIGSLYQRNYPNFNKEEHIFSGAMLVNYLTNVDLYRIELYKIDIKKALTNGYKYFLVRYGTSGFSFGNHIHWGVLLKKGIYVSPLKDQLTWMKLLKQLFNDNRIGEKNYYYSVYTLTFKGKNPKQLAFKFK